MVRRLPLTRDAPAMLLDTHSARRTKPFTPAVTAGIPQEPNPNLPFQTAFAGDPLHALLTKELRLQGPGSPGLFRPPPTHLGVGVLKLTPVCSTWNLTPSNIMSMVSVTRFTLSADAFPVSTLLALGMTGSPGSSGGRKIGFTAELKSPSRTGGLPSLITQCQGDYPHKNLPSPTKPSNTRP